jgi:hypothetical protein
LKFQLVLLVLAVPLAFTVPLLPFIVNGAPFIGDAWVHLKIAEETVRFGRYRFADYNTQWPLVNLLIALIVLVPGMPPLMASQMIPVLSGLAALPFYAFCRRLGLSRGAALFGIAFLNFNPLYTYFTFSGAVMKETASYYLVLALLMVTAMKLRRKGAAYLTGVMLGLALVLGHHFAAMIVALYFCSYLAYGALGFLEGRSVEVKMLASVGATYLLVFLARNLMIYQSIGSWLPVFTLSDGLVLGSCLLLIWAFGFSEARGLRVVQVGVVAAAFVICVIVLRGGVIAVLTPTEPISLGELRNYIVVGALSVLGLALAMKSTEVRSFAVPVVGWTIFAFIFDLTEVGLMIFTKALHYFGVLLALGGAFVAHLVQRRWKGGNVALLAAALVLVYFSSFGMAMALEGPGAYTVSEVRCAERVVPFTEGIALRGDLRSSYLWQYLSKSRFRDMTSAPRPGEVFVLTATNRRVGFLLGYQWAPAQTVLQRLGRYNLLVNSPELSLLEIL